MAPILFLTLALAGPATATSWQVTTEPVTDIRAVDGNAGATLWGYHQPIIARGNERLYCALIEPYGERFDQSWSLYERDADGWRRVYSSPRQGQLNQPPSIAVDNAGTIHVFAWPDGIFTQYRFDPGSDTPHIDQPASPYDDLYPYAATAINAAGELLAVASQYEQNTFSLLVSGADQWRRGRVARHAAMPASPSGFARQAYPFVALQDRAAHVFTTLDIADPDKIAAGFDFVYSFRNLQYYYTPDILTTPFERTEVVNVEESAGWAHNDDLLVGADGRVHLLYRFQRREGDWGNTPLMHAFGPPGGPLTHVQLGSAGSFNMGRLWQAADGTLYALLPRFKDLHIAALGPDGDLAHEPVDLGFFADGWNNYGRIFMASARASSQGAPFAEGLYAVQLDETAVQMRYFRAELQPATAVAEALQPTPSAVALEAPYPNPFNAATTVRFAIQQAGAVRLEVFGPSGQKVRTLIDGPLPPGTHEVTWKGRDDDGHAVATGTYLVRLTTEGAVRQQKATFVK